MIRVFIFLMVAFASCAAAEADGSWMKRCRHGTMNAQAPFTNNRKPWPQGRGFLELIVLPATVKMLKARRKNLLSPASGFSSKPRKAISTGYW
jgi:hypothetical protein